MSTCRVAMTFAPRTPSPSDHAPRDHAELFFVSAVGYMKRISRIVGIQFDE